jgi:hypothetical protein
LNYGLDVEAAAQDMKTCSANMPTDFNVSCEIAVTPLGTMIRREEK